MKTVSQTRIDIKGNTLKVYMYALKHGACELRDIQRALGFSSASLVSYHLNRLIEAGYVKQENSGKYVVEKDLSGDLIEGYTKIGTSLVPQLFFVTLLFTILVAYFSFLSFFSSGYVLLLIAASISSIAALWFETVRVWRRLVSDK